MNGDGVMGYWFSVIGLQFTVFDSSKLFKSLNLKSLNL